MRKWFKLDTVVDHDIMPASENIMKYRILIWCLMFCFSITAAVPNGIQIKPKDLPQKHRKWIEEEVFYIITPKEREVFLQLQSDTERDFFIEAFWRHRDPTVGTEANELKEEHYRRLNHANRRFRGAGKPGWRTDRGKVYILLGEPRDVRVFRGSDIYFPAEAWYYQGIRLPGLPAAFQLLFYQKGRIGEHILYNPAMEGPSALIGSFMDDPTDYMGAYYTLQTVDPVLAETAISLIPGETIRNFPSMASQELLQNLDGSVQRSVADKYAQKFLDYKDMVEVDYSVNYIESDAQLKIIKDDSGIAYVHFSLEPVSISMASYESQIYTRLEFNGLVRDQEGRTVYQFENSLPLNFTPDQYQQMRQRPFAFRDVFPLAPGDYSFSFLAKNTISKEFTSFEATIKIPEEAATFTMTSPILGFNSVAAAGSDDRNKPYVVQNVRLYSQARNAFIPRDTLHVYFQIWALPVELKLQGGSLTYVFYKEDTEVHTVTFPLSKYGDPLNFMEVFPLQSFLPGYYQIRIVLQDTAGSELLTQKENFEIQPLEALPRPWVIALKRSLGEKHQVYHILGEQKLGCEDYAGAEIWLEKAFRAAPANPEYRISFAKSQYHMQKYPETLALLEPFSDKVEDDYDLTWLLAKTYQALGRLDEALRFFNQAVSVFGVNADLLNSLGECYIQTGNTPEALLALEKSLELDPGQEKIQELVRSLKK